MNLSILPSKEIIEVKDYPPVKDVSAYMCQAVKVGELVFCSGVTARDPVSLKIVPGGMEEQTRQAFENVRKILKAAGAKMEDIVKTTVYFRNREHFPSYAKIRAEIFKTTAASTGVYNVDLFDPEALIEIDVIAVAPS